VAEAGACACANGVVMAPTGDAGAGLPAMGTVNMPVQRRLFPVVFQRT
jgi:hypothetical protein